MATMQKALTGSQAGSNLSGTLTKPATAAAGAAAPPPEVDTDQAQSDAAIEGYKKRLQEIMASHSDVDYDKLYATMQGKMGAMKPATPAPNPLISAAAAFGSPRAGEHMVGQASQHAAEQTKISESRMALNLELLDKKAEQEKAKGQFQKALDTNAAATQLETELGRIRAERAHKNAAEIAQIQGEGRANLETQRQQGRVELQKMRDEVNRERIKAAEARSGSLKLSPADKAAMDAEYAAAKRDLAMGTGFNQETMTMPTTEESDAAYAKYKEVTDDIVRRYTPKQIGVNPGKAGVKAETEPPAVEGGKKWAEGLAAAKKAREAAAAKK